MTSVGETLRRERLRQGRDLEQIARETRISHRFLEAIEADSFDKLPGGVFAKNFVRQYARTLGLDEDELAGEVQRQIQLEPAPSFESHSPEPERQISLPRLSGFNNGGHSSSWLSSLALVVAVMLVCSGVYAWWQKSKRPAEVAAQPPATHVAEPASQQASAPPPQTVPAPSPVQTQSQPAAVQPAPQQQQQPQPQQAQVPVTSGSNNVTITAKSDTWVRVQADGKTLVERVLKPNESRTVSADNLRVRIGDASGVIVSVNGRDMGPIGPAGQIREISITPAGAQVVPPKPKPVPEDRPPSQI